GAKVDDTTLESFIFRLDGQTEKIDRFIGLMKPLGLVEVARTGAVAISRGQEGI
ncbi:MAG: acetolactate synthase small subunit, partial [Rhodospirillaceae bacterium]|nr:acetolactate synthase small subunit [Rhodospirillaceae bacterium]